MVLWPLERRIRSGSSILSIHHPELKYTVLERGRTINKQAIEADACVPRTTSPCLSRFSRRPAGDFRTQTQYSLCALFIHKNSTYPHLVAVVVSEVAMLPVCPIIHSQTSDHRRTRHSHEFGDSLDGVRNQVLEKRGHNFLFERRQCLDDLSINLVVLLPHLQVLCICNGLVPEHPHVYQYNSDSIYLLQSRRHIGPVSETHKRSTERHCFLCCCCWRSGQPTGAARSCREGLCGFVQTPLFVQIRFEFQSEVTVAFGGAIRRAERFARHLWYSPKEGLCSLVRATSV
jgi:hypothetical protein